MSDSVTKSVRMTVTKLGHKLDDLTEVMDIITNEVMEIKSALKSLVEVQKEIIKATVTSKPEPKTQDETDFTMYG